MRWLMVVVMVCGACEPGGTERKPRWPHHREIEEQRISDLEAKVTQLEREVHRLEQQLQAPPTAAAAATP